LNLKRPLKLRLCTIGCIIAALCGCQVLKLLQEPRLKWTN
jgi:hypothetical protein